MGSSRGKEGRRRNTQGGNAGERGPGPVPTPCLSGEPGVPGGRAAMPGGGLGREFGVENRKARGQI